MTSLEELCIGKFQSSHNNSIAKLESTARMRISSRLLALPTDAGSTAGLKPAPIALLPPIPLYRRVLRGHRKFLPREMRLLGDEYVKSEFRAHRNVENPVHIIGFLTEWQMYAQKIEGDSWMGEKLDSGKIDKMSDQQLGQLYELMQAIQKKQREDGADNV
ncbi:acetate non-utilizing protein 9 [Loxospora ochrophaea]|nr:acetate non-utilizing protein 9 [Loxospora ochrophaea]